MMMDDEGQTLTLTHPGILITGFGIVEGLMLAECVNNLDQLMMGTGEMMKTSR